jgi:cell division protein FtsL
MILGAVFALCFIMQSLVSIFITSDAFKLEDLKSQRNLVQDQRDAILIQVNQSSSPENLASAATKLGMKPAENITYVDMSSK